MAQYLSGDAGKKEVTGDSIRSTVLEVIAEMSRQGSGFQSQSVLQQCARRLGFKTVEEEQALLTFFYDLFRQGYLAWGYNLSNSEPPFLHLTTQGSRALQQFGRDPANPAGYLAYLRTKGSLNPISESYVNEALRTYNADCEKATAVMVGAAAEAIVLEVRDKLVARLGVLGATVPKDLTDWRIKRVLEAIRDELDGRKTSMPKSLSEAFEASWPAFTQQIRTARNDAGHPASVDPVSSETVHASLLIFPELVSLANELVSWIDTSMK